MTEKLNQSLRKRGFNLPHVFSWQIVVLLVVYAIFLGLALLNTITDGSYSYYSNYDNVFRNLSNISFISGLIVPLVQFRFFQIKTKCITTLSFGESRKSLFRKKFWFPLGAMVLITISFYVVSLFSDQALKKNFSVLADEWLANMLITLLPLFVGYVVGAFARVATGKTDETLVFCASVCGFPFLLFNAIDSMFALSLKGYYTVAVEYYAYTNYISAEGHAVTKILSLFDPLYTLNLNIYGFGNQNASNGLWFETPAFYIIKNLVWIVVLIVAVFLIENHFVKRFKAEWCDKSGKNKFVRTMCALTISLGVVAFCLTAFYQGLLNDALPEISFSMVIAALIWAVILTLIFTALLYRKGTKLRYSFLGIAVTTGLSVIIYLISVTGCFGYSTYMPDSKNIKSVMINDVTDILPVYDSSYFHTNEEEIAVDISFKTREEIEIVKDIHKFIATDKNYDTTETFTIIYELENGELIYRTYSYLSDEACEKISTLWETQTVRDFYKVILNQDEELNCWSYKRYWQSWEKAFAFNTNRQVISGSFLYDVDWYDGYYYDDTNCNRTIAAADSLVVYSKDCKPTCISNEQISSDVMESLKKAIYEDYMNMSASQHYKPQQQIGVISLASCVALLEEAVDWWDEEENGKLTAEELLKSEENELYRFSVTSDMVNTIKVLKNAGVYKYFKSESQVEEAHLIDSQKLIRWMNSDSLIETVMVAGLTNDGDFMSGLTYTWEDYTCSSYLMWGCGYIPKEAYDSEGWEYYQPISESDIEKITPEEAEKLREKAFMTYNAGNDCQFLVMKYTDGTANMLVIPN